MTMYRNELYKGRSYECTNVVACEPAPNAKLPAGGHWSPVGPECARLLKQQLTRLWVENGVAYYGHL